MPMLNLSKISGGQAGSSSQRGLLTSTLELKKLHHSYKKDAVTLLMNRLNKKFRVYFDEIKDFASFQEVSVHSFANTLIIDFRK